MSSWTPQSLRYVGLQQATAAPSGYHQTAAAPNAASTFSRNGVWSRFHFRICGQAPRLFANQALATDPTTRQKPPAANRAA